MGDLAIELVVGLAGGILGGLLGVGGGILFVPAMVILLEEEQTTAQGVSLVVVVGTAAVAVGQHWRNGTVDLGVWRWMVVPAIVMGLVGGVVAGAVGNDGLRRLFGVVALLVAVRMALSAWRTKGDAPPRPRAR